MKALGKKPPETSTVVRDLVAMNGYHFRQALIEAAEELEGVALKPRLSRMAILGQLQLRLRISAGVQEKKG